MALKHTIETIDADQLRADAAELAGTVAEQVGKAYDDARTRVAEVTRQAAPVKRHRALKCLGWLTLAGAAAGAAYVVWRRSQPVEDPWAEEYWADSTEDSEEN